MRNFEYRATSRVEAAQWTGENLEEMKELLAPFVDHDEEGPQVYSEYIEPYFLRGANIDGGGYNMLLFYAAGDDQEVDAGRWVVTYDDGEVEIMDDEQFQKMFTKVG